MKRITAFLMLIIFNSSIIAQPDWTTMSSGTTKDINAIWGSSPYNVYAVGEDGLILHYDGFVWENISATITSDLVDIIGFSASEIYILSSDTLYERVGNTWGVFATSPSFFYGNAIWGTSGTSLFVGGGMPSGGSSGMYYYNGTQWQTQISGFSTINDIYGSNAGDIYAGGNHEGSGGKTHHFKNCTGSNLWWPTVLSSEEVTGVWATGLDNAFASTNDGRVYGYTGQLQNSICWQEIWNVVLELGFGVAELQGIWGFTDRIYTFGSKNRLPIGTTTSLIYQFNGQNWTEMTTQTDSTNFKTVYSVWGTDTSNVFAVGENGLILRLHGEIYDTLVVNKTSDEPDLSPGDGVCDVGGPLINGKPPCTLNAAIMESNATPSNDNIIIFDIAGELPHFIVIDSPLPAITDKVIIKAPRKIVDGISEPGVYMQGTSLNEFNGLSITGGVDGTELYNLEINNFKGHGININGSSEIIIKGCRIKNEKDGIHILNSSHNQIGGEGVDNRNIISGNGGNGISILGPGSNNNIMVNNFIGTTSDGIIEIPNLESGIFIKNSSGNEIGRDFERTGNIVSGNVSTNIYLVSSFNNKIKGNIIGLNINGDSLHNGLNGITLSNSSNNEIGGFNSDSYMEKNVISRNIDGIRISNGSQNTIGGNFIGTDLQGLNKRGNAYGIKISNSDRNVIGSIGQGYLGEFNLISGNYAGIAIEENDRTIANDINNNIIGSNFNNDSLGNDIGIVLFGGFDTRIGKTSEIDSFVVDQKNNWIYYNKTGLAIFNLNSNNNTEVLKNHFYRNETAVSISGTENLSIINNHFDNNESSIIGTNSNLYVHNNLFTNSSSPGSSIHLNNSYGDIRNNLITLDAGDAIKLEDGSTADINYNNIFDNSGFGLNNTTPSIITNAQSNWWGNANGPGGQGPGNGDPVSSGVDFSNWLTELLAVTVTASKDTVLTPIESSDSAFAYVGNWLNPDDILDISLIDNLNWLQSALNYSIDLDSIFGVSTKIQFQVPGSVTPGTRDLIQVTAVSQSNPSHSQTDTFYIEAYQPIVNVIFITPDTVYLALGDSIQFLALGYDQHNKIINFTPQWNSTGGAINSDGWFTAGTQTGTFEVTANDPSSQVQGIATVIISPSTDIKEELGEIPKDYNLYQNYPNPFNPATTIRYAIPFTSKVSISVYNILGERIEKLISEIKHPGIYEMNWNASEFASGVYIYFLLAEPAEGNKIYRNAKKLILLK